MTFLSALCQRPWIRVTEMIVGHFAAIVVGLMMMIVGLALGVTIIMLPVGVVVGMLGVAIFVGGFFARINQQIMIALVALFLSSVPISAQQVKIAPDQQYVNLEILKVGTLAQELNDAGKQGFRLKMSAVNEARVTALMERATPPDVFEYRIVSTFTSKTGDKEMTIADIRGLSTVVSAAEVH